MQALFDITVGVVKPFGPVVPLVDDFVGEGVSSCVVSTITIVDFLHHFLSFIRTETSQMRVRVETRIGFLIQGVPEELVPGGQVLELLCLYLIVGNCFVFQVGDDGVPPPW